MPTMPACTALAEHQYYTCPAQQPPSHLPTTSTTSALLACLPACLPHAYYACLHCTDACLLAYHACHLHLPTLPTIPPCLPHAQQPPSHLPITSTTSTMPACLPTMPSICHAYLPAIPPCLPSAMPTTALAEHQYYIRLASLPACLSTSCLLCLLALH